MNDKEKEVEDEDLNGLLFGNGNEEDLSKEILTPEVEKVIKSAPAPKKAAKKAAKKKAKKKAKKSASKAKKLIPKSEQESKPEPEAKIEPIAEEPPKDEFVDSFFEDGVKPKPKSNKPAIDGGPFATETHEANGRLRRNRKLMKRFP